MDPAREKRTGLVVDLPSRSLSLIVLASTTLAIAACQEEATFSEQTTDLDCSDGLDMHWEKVLEELKKFDAIAQNARITSSNSDIFAFPVKYAGADGQITDLAKQEFEADPEKYITMLDFRKILQEAELNLGVGTYRGMMLMNGAVGFEFGNKECELKIDSIDIARVRNWVPKDAP